MTIAPVKSCAQKMDVKENDRKQKKKKRKENQTGIIKRSFLQFMLFCCLNTRWYYSSNQWSYTQYWNNNSWHSDRVHLDDRFSNNRPEGGSSLTKMKEHEEIMKSKHRKKKKNPKNEESPLVFLMMMAKPKWMLQLLYIYIRWSNINALIFLNHLPHISLSQINTPVFSHPSSQSE